MFWPPLRIQACSTHSPSSTCCPRHNVLLPATQCSIARDTVFCCSRHSVLSPATQCSVALGTVFCCSRRSVMLPATQCSVARDTVFYRPRHSVLWPAETFEKRECLLTLSLTRLRQRRNNLKIYVLIIYANVYDINTIIRFVIMYKNSDTPL